MAQLNFGTGDYVDFGTTEATTATTAVLDGTLITNAVVGDLIVVLVHDQTASSTATTAPSATGWTRYGAANGSPDSATSRQTGVYYYAIDSTAKLTAFQASHTWTFASSGRVSCIATRATGIDLDNPTAGAATAFTAASGSTAVIAAITTATSPALVVAAVHRQNSAGSNVTLTSIAGMTLHERRSSVSTAISNTSTGLGYLTQASAGTTGTVTATWSGTVAAAAGELVAFKVGAWSPPNAGKPVKYTSATNTLATGALYYTSATNTLSTPTEVRPFPTGYTSVTAMLAGGSTGTPFYVAHRGGSLDWPEMSLHAYTQAGFWGVGGLEVSLSRTSDGVWFGLHDDTLDRTSGVTGSIDPSNLTWSALQATYSISAALPSGQTAKPYMRLDALLAAYGATHILFVDPKTDLAHLTELLDLMAAFYGSNAAMAARVVLKTYGVSAMTVPTAAAGRGMKTWGYFYGADSANYTTYAGRWDILGQDYQATAQNWTDLIAAAPTKPIMGHICPTAAAVTTCTGRGAIGAMVSGVTAAITRST